MPWEGHNAAEFAYGEGSAVGSEARARALYRKVLNLGVPSAHGHLEALKQFPQSVAAALFDEGARAKMRERWRRAGAARSLL